MAQPKPRRHRMRYKPDEYSSHQYEVKNFHMKGARFTTVCFYLRVGEPVNIKIDSILKKTNIWLEPTKSEPKREYHVFFEVESADSTAPVDVYMSTFIAKLEEEST